MKQDLCKLSYIHTVYVPLQSMTYGFQSEVRFANSADILFSILNSCFVIRKECHTCYFKQSMYGLFLNKKKEENMRLVIYKSSITKGRKLCY